MKECAPFAPGRRLFPEEHARVIDANQIAGDPPKLPELVDRLFTPCPVAVIVNYDEPAIHHAVVQRLEAELDRLVPVAVQMEQRDLANDRQCIRDRFLEPPPDEMYGGRVASQPSE